MDDWTGIVGVIVVSLIILAGVFVGIFGPDEWYQSGYERAGCIDVGPGLWQCEVNGTTCIILDSRAGDISCEWEAPPAD